MTTMPVIPTARMLENMDIKSRLAAESAIRTEDRRAPWMESRRKGDCFPSGGAVVIAISIFSLVSMAIGVVVGALFF